MWPHTNIHREKNSGRKKNRPRTVTIGVGPSCCPDSPDTKFGLLLLFLMLEVEEEEEEGGVCCGAEIGGLRADFTELATPAVMLRERKAERVCV